MWLQREIKKKCICTGPFRVPVRAVLRRAGLHRQVARGLRVGRGRRRGPRHQPDTHRDGRHGRQEERLHYWSVY